MANDIVGIGKVAQSASIPILSTCLIQQAILPTCLLSRHTGANNRPYIQSFSKGLDAFLQDWQSNPKPNYDGFFAGYLFEATDADTILAFLAKEKLPFVLDPIMADKGQLYSHLGTEHLDAMTKLAKRAQLVLPNLSEACLLSNQAFPGNEYTKAEIKELMKGISQLGPEHVIVTGLSFDDQSIGVAYYNSHRQEISYHMRPKLPYHFFGTGDIFSAIMTAGFFYDFPMEQVIEISLDFLYQSLQETLKLSQDLTFGICFEPFLTDLGLSFKKLLEETHDV
ncbi:phosphomethylpyrimidine kinase [Streptococcus ictaluri 707-05]|uniref:pyridoxal kinase n=1 Tax=Streptococcus ictaluri 707-05 TaxID=764299 RepID=G5K300_9STRE|nr:phosphomethylpyrimidine kinase [Streptococcus ictaluri 707-05]